MNNIGTCCVSDSLELLAHSHDFADAVVLLPPFYFAPVSPAGVKEFFSAVLRKAKVKSYLYNYPPYTQVRISPSLLQDIAADIPTLKGI
jgi:dihydrodipicolinate synthase/N-acetylneuraminate lyase